jgi:ribulose-phosphate 3-epimerase
MSTARSGDPRAGLRRASPSTRHGLDAVAHLLDDVDLLCVMTVNPGFGGQSLIPAMLDKVRALKAMVAGRPIRIQVDGGVSLKTARSLAEAGADLLVAGSAVFQGGPDAYGTNIRALRDTAQGVMA